MNLPWLKNEQTAFLAAHQAGRLTHALLIHEARGSGGEVLAQWMAQQVLNTQRQEHPDLLHVRPSEESKQIRIEQVRELSAELAFTAHQGGYKVGILAPADTLNRHAANALLKTLEEPTPRTLLILVATQPSRLPATLLSRCQRIRIAAPSRAAAIEWLQATHGPGDWNAVLDVVGCAPLLAESLQPQSIAELASDTRHTLEQTSHGRGDPVATAERWARTDLSLRLNCFENWLTEQIRGHFSPLPRKGQVPNIRRLFGLVSAVQELKASLDAPINRSLALESVLRGLQVE